MDKEEEVVCGDESEVLGAEEYLQEFLWKISNDANLVSS